MVHICEYQVALGCGGCFVVLWAGLTTMFTVRLVCQGLPLCWPCPVRRRVRSSAWQGSKGFVHGGGWRGVMGASALSH
eukprot:7740501-Alexandrium_andersonii.AAC.1